MQAADDSFPMASLDDQAAVAPARRRPKPGERRIQILHALAAMLERPGAERVTTAALAARLEVSEAALYRHFASKAQMFEALIDFIESSVFGLVNQINERESSGPKRAARIVTSVLQFAHKNPGMARVMAGDALVFEHDRLQQRMNLLFDKLEAALRQALRGESAEGNDERDTPERDAKVRAAVLAAWMQGCLHRYARSGFRRSPLDQVDASLDLVLTS